MRIHHHVSLILFVAIIGAVGLALTVGLFLIGIENSARDSGKAAEQFDRVEAVVIAGEDLQSVIGLAATQQFDGNLPMIRRSLSRVLVELSSIEFDSVLSDRANVEGPIGTIGSMMDSIKSMEMEGTTPESFQELRNDVALYRTQLETLHGSVAAASTSLDGALRSRRRLVMLTIGLVCILYLAVIERVRAWTTRRLIYPVQRLAHAALQAMEGESVVTGLEQGTTEELNTLAKLLSSFVDTLKSKVRERTVQVEQQKERLEREVAVRRRAEDQLRHAAFHDKLTGLCNRDLLVDRLEQCITRARRHDEYKFAVLFLDIDRFKEVNDSLGHHFGDQLLVAIAERIQSCLRANYGLPMAESNTVARIGGDEFVVLLDGIGDRSDAGAVAECVQESIAKPFTLQGQEVFTTASIGIAFNEIECERADHLLRDADTAMYYAKAAGKARHEVFNRRMRAEAVARLQLGNDLRRAVEKEELEVAYQPIIALDSGRLEGFEALARWRHREHGDVPPMEFIPRAEETGLIVPLGAWVMTTACRQLRRWQREVGCDRDLSMSVNVSKRQVAEPGLVDLVRRSLEEFEIRGNQLRLEITESVIMENPDSITEVLGQLKELGVQIHMDDFGTGYSSLSYLHRFPLDVLKIDRAFMSTLSQNDDYGEVVHTVVALAHTLKMQVTVEGVETPEQLRQLLSLKCNYVQGYLFAKPLSPAEASRIIAVEPDWLPVALRGAA